MKKILFIFIWYTHITYSQVGDLPESRLVTIYFMDKMIYKNTYTTTDLICQITNNQNVYLDTMKIIQIKKKKSTHDFVYFIGYNLNSWYNCNEDKVSEDIIKVTHSTRPTVAIVDNIIYRIQGFYFDDINKLLKSISVFHRIKIKREIKKMRK